MAGGLMLPIPDLLFQPLSEDKMGLPLQEVEVEQLGNNWPLRQDRDIHSPLLQVDPLVYEFSDHLAGEEISISCSLPWLCSIVKA